MADTRCEGSAGAASRSLLGPRVPGARHGGVRAAAAGGRCAQPGGVSSGKRDRRKDNPADDETQRAEAEQIVKLKF